MSFWGELDRRKLLRVAVAHVVVAGFTTTAICGAATSLTISEKHSRISRNLTRLVERYHYASPRIDDSVSSAILDRYLNTLDGSRLYFLASDIAKFDRYRNRLGRRLRRGDLQPVFDIFNTFSARLEDRVAYAIELLADEPDFTLDESFHFDRTEMPWPDSEAEILEVWRKRVKNEGLNLVLAGNTWAEAVEILTERYERLAERIAQATSDDAFEIFMNAVTLSLDPLSTYRFPRYREDRIQMDFSRDAISSSLQLEGFDFPLIRAAGTPEGQDAQKMILELPWGEVTYRIGVVDVPSFYRDFAAHSRGDEDYTSAARDVARLITELEAEDVNGLVIDLRQNGGGHFTEAIALSGLFIEGGPVVQLRETGGTVQVLDDPSPGVAYDGPLVVLVDRYTAAASEIFAAAIQDYERGIIVGQQTFGIGSVQNLFDLDRYLRGSGNGQLTLTTGKYYRITGESTQHRGVLPDISLPSFVDAENVGQSTRENALPYDRIEAVPFQAQGSLGTEIELLRARHGARAADDPDFKYLLSEISALENLRNRDAVSLNLSQRKIEHREFDKQRLEGENQRRAALGLELVETSEELHSQNVTDVLLEHAARIVTDIAAR